MRLSEYHTMYIFTWLLYKSKAKKMAKSYHVAECISCLFKQHTLHHNVE